MSTSPTTTREWRCRSCSALLGVARGGEVEVRYKTAAYRVRGELTTHCRRCGALSRFDTVEPAPSTKAEVNECAR